MALSRRGRRTCRSCKAKYVPDRENQLVCSFECGIPYGRELARKARERAQRARKTAFRDNDRALQAKLAQKSFNAYIRERDAGLPCVSCGRMHEGQWHAGHYRPTGNNSALRFNEINCHRQCAPCNAHKSGNLSEYRIELIQRIGIDLVEWLERDHPKVTPWTPAELKAINQYYREALKNLKLFPQGGIS